MQSYVHGKSLVDPFENKKLKISTYLLENVRDKFFTIFSKRRGRGRSPI
jgi:hypothetical protein